MLITVLASALAAMGAFAEAPVPAERPDPFGSDRWPELKRALLGDAQVVLDPQVRVQAPEVAEDPFDVVVSVDASALGRVEEVLVIADNNPFPQALRFTPGLAAATLGFRLKLDRSTPVRAAARTPDGIWHLGGTRVRTVSGGCSLPAPGASHADWEETLNQVSTRVRPGPGGGQRLHIEISHPMDTGLVQGVPIFYIDALDIADGSGRSLMRIEPGAPVAMDPIFTLDIPAGALGPGPIRISGRDNNGNLIEAEAAR